MVLLGSFVNAAAIVGGAVLGVLLPSMNERFQRTVVQGMAIALCVLGLSMAMKTTHYVWMVVSLVAGGAIGEWLQIERRFEQVGAWLERRVPTRPGASPVGKAFVTASLVYCVGAMAILGSIDSGVRHDHDVLYAKSIMDGFLSIAFASTLGIGVLFSAVPVLLYQGAIALGAAGFAGQFAPAAIEAVTAEVSAVGGVLIVGIGINLLELQRIRVANLLPAVVVMGAAMSALLAFGS
ncbi:DUF554 domain-containing protein [Paenibacillus sp.]|uniref:DUF554 domain-containing protein n=1 Tax=Paenibacillus sp. TaxID=58172 RepID=UPI002D6CC79E|nr:DUF554 domain-containing protein [Paenibacillus sp.]HZG56223.1 DUF554 domain-containing protein [Paenibacillus sp.]